MASNYEDVKAFHEKFGVPLSSEPRLMVEDDFKFRHQFLYEELWEFEQAHKHGDLARAADSLIDLVYVALGTALWMGLPWQKLWDEVQRANMEKVPALNAEASKDGTGRGHQFDVIKPKGWNPPDIERILNERRRLK